MQEASIPLACETFCILSFNSGGIRQLTRISLAFLRSVVIVYLWCRVAPVSVNSYLNNLLLTLKFQWVTMVP